MRLPWAHETQGRPVATRWLCLPGPGATYSRDRWMGYIFVPTPALSLGEKENRPPSFGLTRDRVCQSGVRTRCNRRKLFPLPGGQGEGKRRFDSHPVSLIRGTPQYNSHCARDGTSHVNG